MKGEEANAQANRSSEGKQGMSEQSPTTGFLELERTTSHVTEHSVGAQSVKLCDVFAIVQRVTHVHVTELPLSFMPYQLRGCVNPDIY